MKKIFAFLLVLAMVLAMVLALAGCGNMSFSMGNYSYKKVHVDTHSYSGCLTVKSWQENEGSGIEVHTEEAGSIFLSEGTYILLEGSKECPFCKNSG